MSDPVRLLQTDVARWHAFVRAALTYYVHVARQASEITSSLTQIRGGAAAMDEMLETGRVLADLTENQFSVLCGEVTAPFDHEYIRKAARGMRRELREDPNPSLYLAAAMYRPDAGHRPRPGHS